MQLTLIDLHLDAIFCDPVLQIDKYLGLFAVQS